MVTTSASSRWLSWEDLAPELQRVWGEAWGLPGGSFRAHLERVIKGASLVPLGLASCHLPRGSSRGYKW